MILTTNEFISLVVVAVLVCCSSCFSDRRYSPFCICYEEWYFDAQLLHSEMFFFYKNHNKERESVRLPREHPFYYSSIHLRTRSVESVGSGHKLGAYVCRFLGVCMIRDEEDKVRALLLFFGWCPRKCVRTVSVFHEKFTK